MKKGFYWILFMAFILVFCNVQFANTAEPVLLKASSFLPKNHPVAVKAHAWIELVNTEMEGKVKVKYVGGPEVVPAMEQIEAVRKGITQISFTAGAHYGTQLPAANSLHLSKLMPWEERESGYFDLMVKEHEKLGVRYLGRWFYGPFYMWLEKPVKTSDELRDRRLRTHPIYDRFYKALGISAVTIQTSEIYTALERGLIEGTSWPIQGPRERGWTSSLKFIINHPFYAKNNTVMVMNLDAWKNLPDSVKSKLEEITASFERDMVAYFQKQIQTEWDLLMKEGITVIEFPPADAKRFLGLAYDSEWADLEKKIPDLVPQLRKTSGN